nr:MAG TPA: hypothetical protein [Caudoviricetes sp.]DAO49828.1 MAG TPA: hypothetical protein [Caudoviricetes sp.]
MCQNHRCGTFFVDNGLTTHIAQCYNSYVGGVILCRNINLRMCVYRQGIKIRNGRLRK